MTTIDNILIAERGTFETKGMKFPVTFERVTEHFAGEDYTDIYALVGGTRIDITLGVHAAIEHMNRHNENRKSERYLIENLEVVGLSEHEGRYSVEFTWTDFVNCKRIYRGVECIAKECSSSEGLYLSYRKPEWYF